MSRTLDNVSLSQSLVQILQIHRTRIPPRKTQHMITFRHQNSSRIMPQLALSVQFGQCVQRIFVNVGESRMIADRIDGV